MAELAEGQHERRENARRASDHSRGHSDGHARDHAHDHSHDHAHSHGHGHGDGAMNFMVHRHRDVQGGAARAAVFGVSDGLVSNVALVLGVAAASDAAGSGSPVLVAGVAGLLAGAASMAAGEYVSMKAQAELVERELAIERRSIAEHPKAETAELAAIYRSRGLEDDQALEVAESIMADPEVALEVHAREEMGIDPDEVGDPIVAAVASFIAFGIGAILPLIPWFFGDGNGAIVASAIIGVIAAAAVGAALAVFTERSKIRTAARQVGWAVGACTLTWAIGTLLGASVS